MSKTEKKRKRKVTVLKDGSMCIDTDCIELRFQPELREASLKVKDDCDNPDVVRVFTNICEGIAKGGKTYYELPSAEYKAIAKAELKKLGVDVKMVEKRPRTRVK